MVVWLKELLLILFLTIAGLFYGFFSPPWVRESRTEILSFFSLKMLVVNTGQSHVRKGADGRQEGWLSKSTGLFGSSLRMPTKSSTICILQGLHPCSFLVPSHMNSGWWSLPWSYHSSASWKFNIHRGCEARKRMVITGGYLWLQTSAAWFCKLVRFACCLQTQIQCS